MTLHSFLTNRFLSLEGKLYSGNLSEIQFKIEAALDKTQSLIIDLDSLERFDQAGAYMFYIASEKARGNNKEIILFCRENVKVQSIFSIVGIQYFSKIPKNTLTSTF